MNIWEIMTEEVKEEILGGYSKRSHDNIKKYFEELKLSKFGKIHDMPSCEWYAHYDGVYIAINKTSNKIDKCVRVYEGCMCKVVRCDNTDLLLVTGCDDTILYSLTDNKYLAKI